MNQTAEYAYLRENFYPRYKIKGKNPSNLTQVKICISRYGDGNPTVITRDKA